MALHIAALFFRIGRTAGACGSLLTRPATLLLATGLALCAPEARATQSLNTRMYLMGEQTCQQALEAGANSTLGGIDYRSAAQELGLEAEFCYCVGTAFMHYAPQQSVRLGKAEDETTSTTVFAEILMENLKMCLNPDSFLYISDLFGGDYDPWASQDLPDEE